MMKNETGRSMVEMLGVLAIIGVLSVAGIAGYTMAMNKYKANEILNAASMAIVLAQTADQGQGGTADAADAGITTAGGIAGDNIVANATAKTVTITGCADTAEPCKTAKGMLNSNKLNDFTVTFQATAPAGG